MNVEFGDEVRFTYVLGGLAREFGPVPPIIARGANLRPSMRRAAAFAAMLLLLAPALARATSNPFGPLPEPTPQVQTTTVPTQTTSSSGSSLNGTEKTALLIGGGVVILIVGYLIMRDARRRAPLRHARVRAAAAPPPPMPPRPGARGLHTGRGKGKAAGKKRRR